MAVRGGIVLCGGQSRRMGRAKALLPWAGRTLIEHVVEILRDVVDEVVVVSTPGIALPPLRARVIEDTTPGLGPLAGIAAGLAALERADVAFVTATDVPGLDPRLVTTLLARSLGSAEPPIVYPIDPRPDTAGPQVPPGVAPRAIAIVQQDGFVQPLAAVYPSGAARLAVELLAIGERSPLRLLEALGYEGYPAASLPPPGAPLNLNRPVDYLEAVREAARQTGHALAPVTVEFLELARTRAGCDAIQVPCGTLTEVLGMVAARCAGLASIVLASSESAANAPAANAPAANAPASNAPAANAPASSATGAGLPGTLLAALDGGTVLDAGHAPIGPGERLVLRERHP